MLKRLFYSLISLIILSVQVFSAESLKLSDFYDHSIMRISKRGASPMTIRQWNNSLIEDIVGDMRIFSSKQQKGIVYSSNNSIYRKLSVVTNEYPHVAVARVIYESKGQLLAYPIQAIFSSTIQHGVKERFDTRYQSAIEGLLYGIAPYSGSPCRFAHSERAVGVYLKEKLGDIVKDKNSKFILI